jgi:hypothetical protein
MLGGSPCDHSMARPRVADGRDGLQHRRLAANILNKQPRTNDGGGGLTNLHRKKQTCYENVTRSSDLLWTGLVWLWIGAGGELL